MEDAYATMSENPAFQNAADILGQGRDDRGLCAAVETLYRTAQCHPDPEGWLDLCAKTLDCACFGSCADTPWGAYLLARFHAFLDGQISAMRGAMSEMMGEEQLERTYLPCFQSNLDQLQSLRALGRWDEIAAAFPGFFWAAETGPEI